METPKQAIFTPLAPTPIGPYSQAIQAGNQLWIAGQIAINPDTAELKNDSFESQVIQVFKNIQMIIESAGGSLINVVKLTGYLLDINQIAVINEISENYFTRPYPVRTMLEVNQLPRNVDFLADAVAIL